jgi:hypothetical protein
MEEDAGEEGGGNGKSDVISRRRKITLRIGSRRARTG